MPLLFVHEDERVCIKVWEIVEDEDFFSSKLIGRINDVNVDLNSIKSNIHRLQYLASRFLITQMVPESLPVVFFKSIYGKLFLKDSDLHVSLSHTSNFVAVAFAKENVAIDIEVLNRPIERLKHKFINPIEAAWIKKESDILEVWCAKEVAFKLYEKKELDFKENLQIIKVDHLQFLARLNKENIFCEYHLYKKNLHNLVMIWGFG